MASNAPSFTSAVAPKRSFNFGNTRAVQANMSSLSAQASVRSGNVVMKAHPDSFMPEFSVKGSGAISLQKNYQDNDFGAGRMKTVVKMGGGDGKFTVTLKTPEGEKEAEKESKRMEDEKATTDVMAKLKKTADKAEAKEAEVEKKKIVEKATENALKNAEKAAEETIKVTKDVEDSVAEAAEVAKVTKGISESVETTAKKNGEAGVKKAKAKGKK